MRLVTFGVGELIDRLTIVDLKLAHGGGGHFETERGQLVTILHQRLAATRAQTRDLEAKLAAVNARLWDLEDQLRALRRTPGGELREMDAGNIAFEIQERNDERAAIVAAINQRTGDYVGPEKI